ncbi:hypothetical protein GYMLUDRAFT_40754 [Collybiopsis luxurians FD-317 M1]|uniref:UFSP1/2/DUB catalytic domain-containing protein n=1 Tax=Collybiopsis luxurians FD-317 M1 TaxID=944289 RepID=A0A0D0BI32_9AGAR|nr:hypothetical protein GYMLUDRAFT_40754 [Collybiopsis luxurians FD-317 M1]
MTLQCQFCSTNLDKLSIADRQRHYDAHLDETNFTSQPIASTSSLNGNTSKDKRKWRVPTPANLERGKDVFWYPAMKTPPPPNFTPGLITVLKKALLKSHAKGTTTRAVLCYERAVLINRQIWDANWGCGYRNFLMSCAVLLDQPYQPMYFPLLDQPIPPGIRNLQRWIEEAWKNGFDPEGREELKSLVDTKKWIGTSDLCAAFLSRGIPVELVDFEVQDPKKGLVPLTNWIVSYFDKFSKLSSTASTINAVLSGASPVVCAPCLPIILQNDGHSRTVVGYELTKSGVVNLLVFDPSRIPSKQLRNVALSTFSSANSSSSSSNPNRGNKRPSSTTPSHHDKRVKTDHLEADNDDNNATWTDDEDEIEIVGERIRMGSDVIEVIGEVRHTKKDQSSPKADKSTPLDEPPYADVLKYFRWENRSFKRKNKYQILYFPLEEPLSENEKRRRKILTSERIS